MVLYVDLVFLLNFFINFLLLLVIEITFKEQIRYLNLILASFMGAFLIIAYLFNYVFYIIFQILGGILIGLIAYYHNNLEKLIIKIASFYLINLTLIGILNVFKITSFYLLLISIVVVIAIIFIESNRRYFSFINANKFLIGICFDNYFFEIKGFFDTGNFAVDLDHNPIVFIDNKYFKKDLRAKKTIEINTINGLENVLAYEPQSFYIKIKHKKIYKKVLVVFSPISPNFDCLLNAWLFI